MLTDTFYHMLNKIRGLKKIALDHLKLDDPNNKAEIGSAMEFVLEGLHYNSRISKDRIESRASYSDMLGSMLGQKRENWT